MNNTIDFEKQEFFSYLDILRETGATNMFGAAPYLQEAFDLTRTKSQEILKEWMINYETR